MPLRDMIRLALCSALLTGLLACSSKEQGSEARREAAAPGEATAVAADSAGPGADVGAPAAPDAGVPDQSQLTSSAATYTDAQRRFIRTAQARFRVPDVYRAALAIEDAVAAQGGFVVSNDIRSEVTATTRRPVGKGRLVELAEYVVQGELTVRVPSDRTQAFLRSIIVQMEFLDRRSYAAADAQFALLRQQLAYQRNQQAQQELGAAGEQGGKLGQKAMAIGARGEARAGRDEALVAQREFEDRVAFSTLDLSLYQLPRLRRTEMADMEAAVRQAGPGFFARLGKSLAVGWHGVLEASLALARLWPLWILVAVVAVLARALRRK